MGLADAEIAWGIEVAGLPISGPEAAKHWVLLGVVREGMTAAMNNKRRKA